MNKVDLRGGFGFLAILVCFFFKHSPFNICRSTSDCLHYRGKNMTAVGC